MFITERCTFINNMSNVKVSYHNKYYKTCKDFRFNEWTKMFYQLTISLSDSAPTVSFVWKFEYKLYMCTFKTIVNLEERNKTTIIK